VADLGVGCPPGHGARYEELVVSTKNTASCHIAAAWFTSQFTNSCTLQTRCCVRPCSPESTNLSNGQNAQTKKKNRWGSDWFDSQALHELNSTASRLPQPHAFHSFHSVLHSAQPPRPLLHAQLVVLARATRSFRRVSPHWPSYPAKPSCPGAPS
jgi:hypothetical protein